MDNQFDSKGGEQNVGQGKGAIGKQVNIFTQPLKPRTVVLASVLAAAVLGASIAGWHLLAPEPVKNSISITDNKGTAVIGDHAVVNNTSGIPPEVFAEYAGKLAVTDSALASFFRILEEQQVPHGDLDSKLREIAATHKELLLRLETVQSTDPQVVRLKDEARQAIEADDYAKAEELLNQAEARDVQAIEQLEDAAKQRRISAAETNVTQAIAQRVQLRYAKAAAYWQKAAKLLPEDRKKEQADYLNQAGYDFHRVARYGDALPLYEQSLKIRREIGDREGEAKTLNNIGHIHFIKVEKDKALSVFEQSLRIMQEIGDKKGEAETLIRIGHLHKGQGGKALQYYEQSLRINQEIGDKKGEDTALNYIWGMYIEQEDYATALKYLEQNLRIMQELGDKTGEDMILNNLAATASFANGNHSMTMKYLEQSLAIRQELGDKAGEAGIIWKIGSVYEDQGDLSKAEPYMSRAVQLAEEIGHPSLEEWRMALAALRAKLKAQQ